MIREIILDKGFENYKINNGVDRKIITNLSRINILVGANNSGKSRFMRALFSVSNLNFLRDDLGLDEINSRYKDILDDLNRLKDEHGIISIANRKVNELLKKFEPLKYLNFESDVNEVNEAYSSAIDIIASGGFHTSVNLTLSPSQLQSQLSNKIIQHKNFLERTTLSSEKLKWSRFYIPTLRGLRKLSDSQDEYKNATQRDYFMKNESRGDFSIFTGLNLFNELIRIKLGKQDKRKKLKEFEDFLSHNFFSNAHVEVTPNDDEKVINISIAHEERSIHDVGDGIQSLIILTYPLYINQGKDIVFFIEEPEHCLHPGFQRIFLETLMKPEFDSFQYFITTHSNHFLDITLDMNSVSIYNFKKEIDNGAKPTFVIENVENESLEPLKSLGVRNSSVFLSNCTIWVEGITDRIYIRKYLEILMSSKEIKFKEDIHFSFVEYGGSNITHWSFLDDEDSPTINVERLCGRLFLITDSDGVKEEDGSAKSERHKKLLKVLKERYLCLKSREVENLISPDIIKRTLNELEGKNAPNLVFNFKEHSDYSAIPLGAFIHNNVSGIKRKYKSKSGTIKIKLQFAEKAISKMTSASDLTNEAIEIAEKIYAFIKSQNS